MLYKYGVSLSNITWYCFKAVQTDPVVETEDDPENLDDQPTDQDMDHDDEGETDESNWYDEDPTWSPEKIDSEYQQIKDEDDSEKVHDNPR